MSDFWSDPSARLDDAPSPKRRRFRKRWILYGLVGAFVVLMILVPKRTPEQIAADEAKQLAADAKDAAAKAEAAAAGKTQLRTETQALWSNVTAAAGGCDNWATHVADTAKAGNQYALYEAATGASKACAQSRGAIVDLDPPAWAKGEVEDAFEEALSTCASAQTSRELAFDKVAEVANGDLRPSEVSEARQAMIGAGNGGMACAATFYAAADKAGLDSSIFNLRRPGASRGKGGK